MPGTVLLGKAGKWTPGLIYAKPPVIMGDIDTGLFVRSVNADAELYFLRGNGFCAGNAEGFYIIPKPLKLYRVRTLIEHFQKLSGFIIKVTLPENTGNISG